MPTLLSAKNVGDTIYIKENNTRIPFIIIHKGSPDNSKYVGFDNGVVVLLFEPIFTLKVFMILRITTMRTQTCMLGVTALI